MPGGIDRERVGAHVCVHGIMLARAGRVWAYARAWVAAGAMAIVHEGGHCCPCILTPHLRACVCVGGGGSLAGSGW